MDKGPKIGGNQGTITFGKINSKYNEKNMKYGHKYIINKCKNKCDKQSTCNHTLKYIEVN